MTSVCLPHTPDLAEPNGRNSLREKDGEVEELITLWVISAFVCAGFLWLATRPDTSSTDHRDVGDAELVRSDEQTNV